MWQVSIRELQLLESMKTPLLMQKSIARALYALTAAYSLSFPGKQEAAACDFIIPALMNVLIRAQLQHPFALQKYLEDFILTFSSID